MDIAGTKNELYDHIINIGMSIKALTVASIGGVFQGEQCGCSAGGSTFSAPLLL